MLARASTASTRRVWTCHEIILATPVEVRPRLRMPSVAAEGQSLGQCSNTASRRRLPPPFGGDRPHCPLGAGRLGGCFVGPPRLLAPPLCFSGGEGRGGGPGQRGTPLPPDGFGDRPFGFWAGGHGGAAPPTAV